MIRSAWGRTILRSATLFIQADRGSRLPLAFRHAEYASAHDLRDERRRIDRQANNEGRQLRGNRSTSAEVEPR
jgi:hypothetical protein